MGDGRTMGVERVVVVMGEGIVEVVIGGRGSGRGSLRVELVAVGG